MFPSGCHRHPDRFQRISDLQTFNSHLNSLKSSSSEHSEHSSTSGETRNYSDISSGDCLSSSTRTLSADSGHVKGDTSDQLSFSEDSDLVVSNRSKSSDRLSTSKSLERKKRLGNLSLLSGGTSRLAGIVGSGSRILRRHTTYIRNPASNTAGEENNKLPGHVHSWHIQVGFLYLFEITKKNEDFL